MNSSSRLVTGSVIAALLVVGAIFLDWAVPERTAAELYADTLREHAEGQALEPAREAAIRQAYPLQGTDEPFHGVLLAVIAGLAAALLIAGSAVAETQAARAETLLRAGGVALGLAFVLALLDTSSEVFALRNRGLGLYLALVCSLAGCLAGTVASARVAPGAEKD
ncbi:MAG: hypothetical protein O2894_03935 [Planctomycetota bacterium]|nr:hypothetical protein [Planctomycetota bacterium]